MATDCIGEDAELVVRIYRWLGRSGSDGKVVFVSEPVAWTEAPEDRAVLRKQRRRWHRGLAEILTRAPRHAVPRRATAWSGMLSMPWFVAFELLAPFVEMFGAGLLPGGAPAADLGRARLANLELVDGWSCCCCCTLDLLYAVVLTMVALLTEEMSFRRYRGVGDLARRLGGGGGELRLPPAQRVVADGWRHRGMRGPARLGRHAARGLGKT